MTIKQQGGIFGRNPTFNDVDVEGTLTIGGSPIPAPASTLVSSDIGVTVQGYDFDTAKLDAAQTFTAEQTFNNGVTLGSGSALKINDQDSILFGTFSNGSSGTLLNGGTSSDFLLYVNGRLRMSVDTSGNLDMSATNSGNIILKNGNGIDFSATSGTGTSELFDDYEEGTWTPSLAFGTSVVLNSAAGTYTKMGRLVYVTFNIDVTSHTQPDGSPISINGLPYNIASDIGTLFSIDPLASTFIDLTTTPLGGIKTSSNTYLQLHQTDRSSITYTEAAASGKLVGAAMYEAS